VAKGLELVACDGTTAAAVVGNTVRVISAMAVGGPVLTVEYPMPPGGRRIVSLDARGPSAVCDDGTLWCVAPGDVAWRRVGSLNEVPE
jgi:hypothetical protein